MFLEELVPGTELENLDVECKLKLDRTNPDSWLRTIAGFANASGGVIYVGVEDTNHQLIGFDRAKADQENMDMVHE